MNLKKVFISLDAIDYFGHVFTPRRKHIITKTDKAVRGLKYPTSKPDPRSFLVLSSIYFQVIPNFLRVAAFSIKLLQKCESSQLELNNEKQQTVDDLKQKLVALSLLTILRPNRKFAFGTDACDKKVGCVFIEEQKSGKLQPIECCIRTLKDGEKTKTITTHRKRSVWQSHGQF